MTYGDIESKVVKKGICVYAGTKEYFVYICIENVFYGTGDHEDIRQVAEDRAMQCYAVYFSDMLDVNRISASAGQYESYEMAVKTVEDSAGFLKWMKNGQNNR